MDTFTQISLILIVAALFAWVMQAFRLPIILGHLLTGILIGPAVFNVLRHQDVVEVFSQFGITALLFMVGLGLAPQVMREVGKVSLLAGTGQIVLTGVLGFLLGRAFGFSLNTSLYLAAALTFSSTIIVSKFLTDRKEIGTLYGKIAIGLLLVQDIVATVFLVILSASERSSINTSDIVLLVSKGLLVVGILYLVCRRLLPRVSRLFALSQEFLFLFSLAWGLGLALVFRAVGFSLEIGALAAGVTLAASPYHYEIAAKMKLLRDFFLVPFFVLLGSHIVFQNLHLITWPLVAMSAFVVIGKPLIVLGLLLAMGYHRKTSLYTSLTLGQISEFSFLLILMGTRSEMVPPEGLTLIALIGLVSMTLSVILMHRSAWFHRYLQHILAYVERRHIVSENHPGSRERFEAILFGCHRVGSDFLTLLRKRGGSYLVVDFDPTMIAQLEEADIPCRYGDAADNEFLDELGLRQAKLVISTLPDIETNTFLLAKIRRVNRQAIVILTTQGIEEALLLYEQGASYVVLPHFLGGNYASLLLEKHGMNPLRFEHEKKRHMRHLSHRRRALASSSMLGVH
jgi:Kef-type K+ transport system membrane component KefB